MYFSTSAFEIEFLFFFFLPLPRLLVLRGGIYFPFFSLQVFILLLVRFLFPLFGASQRVLFSHYTTPFSCQSAVCSSLTPHPQSPMKLDLSLNHIAQAHRRDRVSYVGRRNKPHPRPRSLHRETTQCWVVLCRVSAIFGGLGHDGSQVFV